MHFFLQRLNEVEDRRACALALEKVSQEKTDIADIDVDVSNRQYNIIGDCCC